MTDVQIFLPLATFMGTLALVVVGFLYSNSWITDLRTDMNNRFGDFNNRFGDFEKCLMQSSLASKRSCSTNSRNSTTASCGSKID